MKQSIDQIKAIIAAINQNWDSFSDEEQETWENFIAGLDELL